MRESGQNLCVVLHMLILSAHDNTFQVKSFVDSGNNGLDGIIPRSILERASGFAIFTIIKAGFLFSARGGAGIVIARLDNGCEPLASIDPPDRQ